MKIRTIYQKVKNMEAARTFWESFFGLKPSKNSTNWCQFNLENINFALLLDVFDDEVKGSNAVPVFELLENEIVKYVKKAEALGCVVVIDGLENPDMQSIVLKDPAGNEFEISKFHI
jgi:catechol 2,3-dioxygenase-like lactoylglutathione lyase family enzyme